jgi:hypothetical protein
MLEGAKSIGAGAAAKITFSDAQKERLIRNIIIILYILLMGTLLYLFSTFAGYLWVLLESLEINRDLGVPIHLSYGWLEGVKLTTGPKP